MSEPIVNGLHINTEFLCKDILVDVIVIERMPKERKTLLRS